MKRYIPDLSIVINNFNTKELIKKTLSSIYRYTKNINFEIILVDDASTDGSVEMVKKNYPEVKVVRNNKNLGYSKSCNIGTRLAKGRYILQLNSDVIFTKGSSLDLIINFMENNPKIGITGCKVIKNDGSLDLPCRHSLPTLINVFSQAFGIYKIFPKIKIANYYMTYLDENEIAKIGGVQSFMLIKRAVIKRIGYLDERFFIYCEDTDYCYRAIKAGWDVYYFPKVIVKHLHGATTKHLKMKALWYFHKGMFLYYEKHHSKKNFFLLNYLVYIGILIRYTLFMAIESIKYTKRFLMIK